MRILLYFPFFASFVFRLYCMPRSHAEFGARENPRGPSRGDFRVPGKLNSLDRRRDRLMAKTLLRDHHRTIFLSNLKLTVTVWRSHRDARDRDTRILATHAALSRMSFTCMRYKTRRTCCHVSCGVACSLPITWWSSLKFAARFARSGHYRRNARREAVRSARNTECPWSCLEFLRGDYIAS